MEILKEIMGNGTTATIGWALIQTLWQGLVIFLVLRLTFLVIKNEKATVKYWLSYLALMVQAGWLLVSVIQNLGANHLASESLSNGGTIIITSSGESISLWAQILGFLNQQAPLFFLLWVIGIVILGLRMAGGLLHIQRLRTRDLVAIDKDLELLFNRIVDRINFSQKVQIFFSERVTMPIVTGLLKPMILIPVGFINGITQQQAEAVLLHELAHIRRKDYLLNMLQAMVEIVLFFNPFVHLISAQVRKERERACDDYVLQFTDRFDYARALVATQEWQLNHSMAMGLHKGESELYNRINRIMGKIQLDKERQSFKKLIAYTVVLGSIALSLAFSFKQESKDQSKSKETPIEEKIQPKQKDPAELPPVSPPEAEVKKVEQEVEKPVEGEEEQLAALGIQLEELTSISALSELDSPEFTNEQLRKLIEEIKVHREDWLKTLEEDQKKLAEALRQMESIELPVMPNLQEELELLENFEQLRKEEFEQMAQSMMKTREQLEKLEVEQFDSQARMQMEKEMARVQEEMKAMEAEVKKMEENMKAAVREMKEQAVKDGYLESTKGKISIDFEEDGIYFNHVKVKKEHEAKYRAIHKKYFPKERDTFHIRDN